MKRGTYKYLPVLILLLISGLDISAQAPEKIAYQAVVRDGTNLLLPNQAIGVQISILRNATAIYVETHSVTTNMNALLSVEVGMGTVVSGQFDTIAWHAGKLYLKADIDPAGGSAYSIAGTTELLSVPYALFTKEAENGFSGDFNDLTNKPNFDGSETKVTAGSKVTVTGTGTAATPYMINAIVPVSGFENYPGQSLGGGIVFYVYKGSDGTEYNLVVHLNEDPGLQWQTANSNTLATRTYDGAWNMDRMTNSPARTYVESLGAAWYLPSIDELNLLWQNRFHVAQPIIDGGGTPISTVDNSTDNYWSSTEFSSSYAWYFSFADGDAHGTPASAANPKGNLRRVRAIRKIQPIIGTPMGGGEVAYVFRPGDPGFVDGEIHGLIKATTDLGNAGWGCTIPIGIQTGLGTGAANTADIVANCATPGIAARLANDYVNPDTGTGVYTDWFLPSQAELAAIANNYPQLSGLGAVNYWSSSGGPGASMMNAWRIAVWPVSVSFLPKSGNYAVLPVRYF